MRKILFLMPLLVICTITTNSYAITQEECDDATSQEECPAGCYWDRTGCKVCGVGEYTTKAGQTECAQCSHPTKGSWEWADESTGHTANDCPWTTTCEYNEYWDISGIINGSNFGCEPCGEHYNSTQTNSYPISGAGIISTDGLQYLKDAVCDGKVYKLDLEKNTLLTDLYWPFERARYEDKTAYAKYNTGFAKSADSTSWSEKTLPDDLLQPDRPYKLFQGYSDNKDCEKGNLYFNADGVFQLDWSKLTSDKTLYACWDNVTVKVNYYNAAGTVYETQSCTVDDTSTTFDCTALDYTGGITDEYAGQIFNYYSCTYGDGTACNPSTVKEGDSIPLGNATINLRPVFQQCSPGYWCDNNQTNPCPAGTTSAGGAASKENCYMVRGNNGTRFCDSNGCFFLPGLGNISFNPDDP